MSKITKILLILILAVELVVQLFLANADSQTTDEAVHVSAGYTYWTKGDFRFNPEHPPLVKLLSALPLVFMDLEVPDDAKYWDKAQEFYYDSWLENRQYSEEFFYSLGNNADLMLFMSRLGPILLTLILGISIFCIANKYWGEKAALAALTLYCFNPIVIAHGHLVTTDIAISLGFLLSIYATIEYLKNQKIKNFLFLIFALSVAFLSKFTAVILVPCIMAVFVYYGIFLKKTDKKKAWKTFGGLLLSFVAVMVIVFAVYGFDYRPAGDTTEFRRMVSSDPSVSEALANTLDKVEGVRYLLVPKYFFKGMSLVIGHTQVGHSAYLMGMISRTGWWYYFPIVFLAKNSIFFVALLATAVYFGTKYRDEDGLSQALLIAASAYFLFSMMSKANLGVRHILPFIISSCVYVSRIFSIKNVQKNFWIIGLVVIIVAESIFAFPYYLSYFSPLAGGRTNGYMVASDSNSDWGQDVKRIKNFVNKNQQELSKCNALYVNYGWNGEAALDYYSISRASLGELTDSTKGCIIIGASAYVMPENAWLRDYDFVRITPSTFFINTQ